MFSLFSWSSESCKFLLYSFMTPSTTGFTVELTFDSMLKGGVSAVMNKLAIVPLSQVWETPKIVSEGNMKVNSSVNIYSKPRSLARQNKTPEHREQQLHARREHYRLTRQHESTEQRQLRLDRARKRNRADMNITLDYCRVCYLLTSSLVNDAACSVLN